MSIEAVSDALDYEISEFREKLGGSDGQRKYILLESGKLCNPCLKNHRMKELGIEKISFQVYQIAEEKLFNVDFKVTASSGNLARLHFHNRSASGDGYSDFFSEVENAATDIKAVGLATLANQAAVIASRHQLPPDKSSAYLRCMDGCDDIEFELFRLLCYALCQKADDTPGS